MSVHWRGAAIAVAIEEKTKLAIDATTAEAADAAKSSHWWRNRHQHLQQEIVTAPAERQGHLIVGKFGTTKRRGFYGLFLEREEPFLRPAADQTFPNLAERIRRG